MPHSLEQWCWFVFYTGGAIGGWLGLAIGIGELMRGFKRGVRKAR